MSYPTLFTTPGVRAFAEAVDAERQRQLAKFGEQHHPDLSGDATSQCDAREMFDQWAQNYRAINAGTFDPGDQDRCLDWTGILLEEVYEALAESDVARLRAELVQVAAVCAAWITDLDSRTTQPNPVVAYSAGARTLRCPRCRPNPLGSEWQPLTADDLEHGGICTSCGVDVLIGAQQ
ncbi:hypothetical protein [Streptomyces longwoodensis]|uniref:hypothetical protein n=1 Tax=Streptomyces longwoodensis TaxID=68231 RepID=UPI00224D03F7|nr:hypothetical protein [Streptomyces longwoodensis]MCX4994284.1 hypothetical protein [Streptomyces longwoodensis]